MIISAQSFILQKRISEDSEKNLEHFQRKLGRISTLLTKEVNKVGAVTLLCNVYLPTPKQSNLACRSIVLNQNFLPLCKREPNLPHWAGRAKDCIRYILAY